MSRTAETRTYPNDHERLARVLDAQPGVERAQAYLADELGGWVVEAGLTESQSGPSPEVLMAIAQAIRQTDVRGLDLGRTTQEWGKWKVVIR